CLPSRERAAGGLFRAGSRREGQAVHHREPPALRRGGGARGRQQVPLRSVRREARHAQAHVHRPPPERPLPAPEAVRVRHDGDEKS
ncbi:unnamed protein product, partial [Ectocarpus fasciculatus]